MNSFGEEKMRIQIYNFFLLIYSKKLFKKIRNSLLHVNNVSIAQNLKLFWKINLYYFKHMENKLFLETNFLTLFFKWITATSKLNFINACLHIYFLVLFGMKISAKHFEEEKKKKKKNRYCACLAIYTFMK